MAFEPTNRQLSRYVVDDTAALSPHRAETSLTMATATDVAAVVEALTTSELLGDLPAAELVAVARTFEERVAEDGDCILRQGSTGEGLGFIIEGHVAVRVDGKQSNRVGRGEPINETSALLDEPVTSDVFALGPVRYLILPSTQTREYLAAHPVLSYRLLQVLAGRLRDPINSYLSIPTPSKSSGWTPASWRQRQVAQQPDWPDEQALDEVLTELRAQPPLVLAEEARALTTALGEAAAGNGFLLQAGDCSESFGELSTKAVGDRLRVIMQMAIVLTYSTEVPVIKVPRMAGQFAKPRSSPFERVGDVELPVYRGDIVNDAAPDAAARVPDPKRLLQAYNHSAAKLNFVRGLAAGGLALSEVDAWIQEFVATSLEGHRYEPIATEFQRAVQFMRASQTDPREDWLLGEDLWTSHEALLLPYEEALVHRDEESGEWFGCSGHLLWVGERTRAVDGAHVEFLSGLGNPVACKVGPTTTAEEVVALCERLNPDRIPGRLTLISRMGVTQVTEALPPLLAATRDEAHPVVWTVDPMHGNTLETSSGRKTRRFDDIIEEVQGFFAACASESTWPGGLHVELTGEDVTECLGGSEDLSEADLDICYTTTCDPRLNASQALDLAFRVAEMLRVGIQR